MLIGCVGSVERFARDVRGDMRGYLSGGGGERQGVCVECGPPLTADS